MELTSDVRLKYPRYVTFTEFFLHRTERYDGMVALVDGETGRSCTYSQLRRDVIRLAAALRGIGVRRGDRVCILLSNCIEFPTIMMAVLQLGAICVPVNYLYTKYELRDLNCEPTFYITTPERLEDIEYSTADISNDRVIKTIVLGDTIMLTSLRNTPMNVIEFESLMRSVPGDVTPDDLPRFQPSVDNRQLIGVICYSSGTTGRPKGCMHSHHALIATGCNNSFALYQSHFTSSAAGDLTLTSPIQEVTIAALSMAHMFGLIVYMAHGLATGIKLIVMRKFDANKYVNLVEKYRATALYVVPPLLANVLRSGDHQYLRSAMSSVRHVMSSAVHLNENILQDIETVLPNVNVCQQYGMTELMTVLASSMEHGNSRGSSGRPVPGVVMKIVDRQTKKSLPPGENGEILVKSACEMVGYWKNPSATLASLTEDCWFITGDVGHYDEQGNVFIVDRLKDILKYKGYQVSPLELETALLRHPDVIDAAVVGVKDDQLGDLPRALVVVRRPDVNTQDISDFVNERVAAFKRIRAGVYIVDNIPRTPSGKIIRWLLKDQANVGNASAPPPPPLRTASKL